MREQIAKNNNEPSSFDLLYLIEYILFKQIRKRRSLSFICRRMPGISISSVDSS